jgi:hypothetical protein
VQSVYRLATGWAVRAEEFDFSPIHSLSVLALVPTQLSVKLVPAFYADG